MTKARRQPAAPVLGDIGPSTEAAMAGATVKRVEVAGMTPTRRKFRDHLLEIMARPRVYGQTTKPPQITGRQRDAGLALHDAWCETMRGSGPIKEYVQTSPDWAAIALGNAERIWNYSDVSAHIPRHCRDVTLRICIQQIATSEDEPLTVLREALTSIADGLRI